MNTDRFLTRVFDTQEKKMIYVGDFFHSEDGTKLMFLGISLALLEPVLMGTDDEGYVTDICIGDRYIPMQCWGLKDKNDKLFYESDFIEHNCLFGKIYVEEGTFMIKYYDERYRDEMLVNEYKVNEIIGNQWEHPELMEESK